jgi:hypothetical protein
VFVAGRASMKQLVVEPVPMPMTTSRVSFGNT